MSGKKKDTKMDPQSDLMFEIQKLYKSIQNGVKKLNEQDDMKFNSIKEKYDKLPNKGLNLVEKYDKMATKYANMKEKQQKQPEPPAEPELSKKADDAPKPEEDKPKVDFRMIASPNKGSQQVGLLKRSQSVPFKKAEVKTLSDLPDEEMQTPIKKEVKKNTKPKGKALGGENVTDYKQARLKKLEQQAEAERLKKQEEETAKANELMRQQDERLKEAQAREAMLKKFQDERQYWMDKLSEREKQIDKALKKAKVKEEIKNIGKRSLKQREATSAKIAEEMDNQRFMEDMNQGDIQPIKLPAKKQPKPRELNEQEQKLGDKITANELKKDYIKQQKAVGMKVANTIDEIIQFIQEFDGNIPEDNMKKAVNYIREEAQPITMQEFHDKIVEVGIAKIWEEYDKRMQMKQPEPAPKQVQKADELQTQPNEHQNEQDRKGKVEASKKDEEKKIDNALQNHQIKQDNVKAVQDNQQKLFKDKVNDNPELKKIADQLKILGKSEAEVEQYIKAYLQKQLLPATEQPVGPDPNVLFKQRIEYIYDPDTNLANSNKDAKINYQVQGAGALLDRDRMIDLYTNSKAVMANIKKKREYTKTEARQKAIEAMMKGKKTKAIQRKVSQLQNYLQTLKPEELPMMNQRADIGVANESIKNQKQVVPSKKMDIQKATVSNYQLLQSAGIRFML